MEDKSAVFSKRMNSVLLNGCLSLGLAMGTEFGLFNAMCKFDRPATTGEIAEAANSKERYVREWLCFMTAGQVVETSEEGETFYLPQEYRKALTGPGLVRDMAPFLTLLPQGHQSLTNAFRKDGPPGVPYSVTAPLLAKFEAGRPKQFMKQLPGIVKSIPGLHEKLESGIEVCDIGSGCGHLVNILATIYQRSHFTGVEISDDAVQEARKNAADQKLQNVTFVVQNAEDLPLEWSKRFDFIIMYDVLHDIPHASKATPEFYRVLKDGGSLAVLDINVSSNPKKNVGNFNAVSTYPFSLYHCMSTSLSVPDSEGLGACVGVEKLTALLQGGGFQEVTMTNINKIAPGMVLLTSYKGIEKKQTTHAVL